MPKGDASSFTQKWPREVIETIRRAPAEVSTAELAEQYGMPATTVRYHRRQAREELEEIRREVLARELARSAPKYVPSAVEALGKVLSLSLAAYEESLDPKQGNLAKACAVAILDKLGTPEDYRAAIEEMSDDELLASLIQDLQEAGIDAPIAQQLARAALRGE